MNGMWTGPAKLKAEHCIHSAWVNRAVVLALLHYIKVIVTGHEGLTTKCKAEAWLDRLCQSL